MRKTVRTLLTVVASAFVALQMGALPAMAQEAAGSGLQIRPPRTEISVERGSSTDFEITLVNIADQPVVAKYFINDFETDGVTGEPRIITDDTVRTDRSIRDLLVNLEDVQLAAKEEKTFKVIVDVPENIAPGGYYGVVRYQAVPLNDQGEPVDSGGAQFNLNASLAALVLIEVPGDFNTSAQVDDINIQSITRDDNGNFVEVKKSGSFFTESPERIAISIRNTGESFVRPFGTVSVTSMFGNVVSEYDINDVEPRGNVLPDSLRSFENEIQFDGFGRYTVEASIAFIQGGEITTISKTFWVIPVWVYIVIAALVLLLGFTGFMIYRKFTK